MSSVIEATALPSFRVMFLGLQSSGKTAYFSVMTHYLELDSPTRRFNLTLLDQRAHKLFAEYYDSLTREGAELEATPPHDAASQLRYQFIPKTPGANGQPLFSVEFMDYGGERLMRHMFPEESEQEISRGIGEASVLVVLLDGEDITELLKKGRASAKDLAARFDSQVNTLLGRLSSNPSLVPVHFMVTKWDACLQANITLANVRAFLQTYDAFREIVASRTEAGIFTRIVPVSSFGAGFIVPTNFLERNILRRGREKINPGAQPKPINIEIPFALAFVDQMRALQRQALVIGQNVSQPDQAQTKMKWSELLRKASGYITRVTTKNAHTIVLTSVAVAQAVILARTMNSASGSDSAGSRSPNRSLSPNRPNLSAAKHIAESSSEVLGLTLLPPNLQKKIEELGDRWATQIEGDVTIQHASRIQQYEADMEEYQRILQVSKEQYERYLEGEKICEALVKAFEHQYPDSMLSGIDNT